MDTYSLSSRILFRAKRRIDIILHSWNSYVGFKMSRDVAKRLRKKVVGQNGRKIVDRKLLKLIKEFCGDTLGSTSFWPWLVLYSELRGEFKEGWIPDDYYRFELLPKMNPEKFMRFSEAKILDHKLFNNYIIEPIFFRSNGLFFDKDENYKSTADVKNILRDINDEIIIKPEAGRGGKNIIFSHSKKINIEDLPHGTNLLFQKVVRQHSELNKLYPHSVNTFRVLTFLDNTGRINIKYIIIRFERGGTRIDNASSGGGWIYIQSNGNVEPIAYDIEGLEFGTEHPDTGTIYSELDLPFLNKVISFCKRLHRSFPYVRIIGWDVFIDQEGDPKLIEWNANNPFFWPIEARFGPFFNDEFK